MSSDHLERQEPFATDRNGLHVLSRDECLRLLREATLGRVGITVDALPVILPVNYRLLGDRIVFRTSPGTKLDAATRNAIVAFEVDDIEPVSHSGWSVVVVGTAREVTDPDDVEELAHANIPRWAPSTSERVVEVSTELVTGRRIGSERI
jgi:nitroimidazol reductase NimA-like FMN-containing flavoprotein (pyridoxamine 5'-phosphate oxidase superfamily)